MDKKISDFINKYIDYIDAENWPYVYAHAQAELKAQMTGELTKVLLDAEIYPHESMSKIPSFYMCNQLVKCIDQFLQQARIIGQAAFSYCMFIESINVPEGVIVLDYGCFANCSNLKQLTLPSTITEINNKIVANCPLLRNIDFKGTVDQFNAIRKARRWDSESTVRYIKCIDGDIIL